MEYVWPSRRSRRKALSATPQPPLLDGPLSQRTSIDITINAPKHRLSVDDNRLTTPLRRVGVSRSFSDLRQANKDAILLQASRSTESVADASLDIDRMTATKGPHEYSRGLSSTQLPTRKNSFDDASEMRTRSSQRTFILVRLSR